MSLTEDFLTSDEEKEVVHAIHLAELNTSGEIRVHLEDHSEKPPLERAQEVFHALGMNQTKAHNGVLFYVAVRTRNFAIIGGSGINNVVESDFWDCTKDIVINHFKNSNFKQGLIEGILRAGERLKKYFPYESDDINELPNDISRG